MEEKKTDLEVRGRRPTKIAYEEISIFSWNMRDSGTT